MGYGILLDTLCKTELSLEPTETERFKKPCSHIFSSEEKEEVEEARQMHSERKSLNG